MIAYKIRNKKTGLFSMGGMDALVRNSSWRKTGKVWKQIGHLKNHINQLYFPRNKKDQIYTLDDFEIVEYSLVESSVFSVEDLIPDLKL
jgi:hypothetical protein